MVYRSDCLLAIFSTLFWVYALVFHEKTDTKHENTQSVWKWPPTVKVLLHEAIFLATCNAMLTTANHCKLLWGVRRSQLSLQLAMRSNFSQRKSYNFLIQHGHLLNRLKSSTFSESVSFLRWSLFWCSTPPYKSLKTEVALILKHLLLWLSNCRKLLIWGYSFMWCKLFVVFMFVYDKNKDTPLWIGSMVVSLPMPNWGEGGRGGRRHLPTGTLLTNLLFFLFYFILFVMIL